MTRRIARSRSAWSISDENARNGISVSTANPLSQYTHEETPERHSLLSVVERERPGSDIKLLDVADLSLLSLSQRSESIWIALNSRPESELPEDLLHCLADMLLFCATCSDDLQFHCRSQRRHLAGKLRGFLGEVGFQRFFRTALLIRTQAKDS